MCRHEGLLVVEVVEARGLQKAELVGKADPLVTLWTQHVHKQQTVSTPMSGLRGQREVYELQPAQVMGWVEHILQPLWPRGTRCAEAGQACGVGQEWRGRWVDVQMLLILGHTQRDWAGNERCRWQASLSSSCSPG